MGDAQTSFVGAVGLYWLFIFGVVLPYAAIRSNRKIKAGMQLPPKRRYFISVFVQQFFLLGLSLYAASAEYVPLFRPWDLRLRDVALGVLFLVSAIVMMYPRWKKSVEKGSPKLYFFTPRNSVERALWIAVSAAAGFGEEISYRGVMFILVERLVHSGIAAALISAIIFGISHMLQGWKSALIIVFFALGFHALVHITGSLYIAMVVHFAYDVTAGLTYGRMVREQDDMPFVGDQAA